jgi:hypothetical protein
LRRGRLWYADGYYGSDGVWVSKSEAFRDWAESVLERGRKAFTKWKTDYVGAEAKQWIDGGGKIE